MFLVASTFKYSSSQTVTYLAVAQNQIQPPVRLRRGMNVRAPVHASGGLTRSRSGPETVHTFPPSVHNQVAVQNKYLTRGMSIKLITDTEWLFLGFNMQLQMRLYPSLLIVLARRKAQTKHLIVILCSPRAKRRALISFKLTNQCKKQLNKWGSV